MAFLKPDVNLIFASTGDVISPPLAKIALGWVSEIPDFEFENWIQNRQDQFMAHINQLGVVAWDETTEYLSNKSYVQVANGDIYRALRTNTGQSPTISNSLDWKLAFDSSGTSYNKSESDALFARRANNLSDLVSAGSARANLSVYSQSESDGRYLNESSNLSDLTNDSTARTNLDVYSRAEVDLKDSVFSRKGANLSDLTSATTARNNLVVYSKSEVYTRGESDGRYLNESSNLSDLTNDAAARSNLYVYSKGESDARYLNESSNLSDLVSAGAARANLSVYSKSESDARYQLASELVGMTSAFPRTTAPSGWLACNGSEVSRGTYSALFNTIGTSSGFGNGSTTFNLPDLRGEFIRGLDDGRGVDAGRSIASSQGDAIKSHNHAASSTNAGDHVHSASTNTVGNHVHTGATNTAGVHNHSITVRARDGTGGLIADSTGGYARTTSTGDAGNHAHSFTTNVDGSHAHVVNIGGAGNHNHTIVVAYTGGTETRPRNVALLYCIKY